MVSKANEVKIASDSGNKDKVGTGSTVEVFYDEDHNDVTICVIDNYVGTVSKTVEAKGCRHHDPQGGQQDHRQEGHSG